MGGERNRRVVEGKQRDWGWGGEGGKGGLISSGH